MMKNLTHKIKGILEKEPSARESPTKLYQILLEQVRSEKAVVEGAQENASVESMPNPASVVRLRQRLQSQYKWLRAGEGRTNHD